MNIGTPLSPEKDLRSLFDVFSQVSRLWGGQAQDRRQIAELAPEDLLILPDLEVDPFTDFEKIPRSSRAGEMAARAVADQLKSFSVSEEEYRRWRNTFLGEGLDTAGGGLD